MTIPKIIHYVWVGGAEKPKDIKRCMKTWKTHLTEYEIIEWNENNFDINSHPFIKQAYEQKKWAFVSDYIRAFVVNEYGGIYLDTDVLVLDNLETLLENEAFVGFENKDYPFTAVFGAVKNHPLTIEILKYYDQVSFNFNRDNQMKEVNTKIVSDILVNKFSCIVNNQEQLIKSGIRVYPDNVLCNPSDKSLTIHVFTGTWMEGLKPLKRKLNKFLKLRLTNHKRIRYFNKLVGN